MIVVVEEEGVTPVELLLDHERFSTAVALVERTVSSRDTIPALTGILLEAGEGGGSGVRLTASDLEMGVTTQIEADVRAPGRVLLPGRLLSSIVRRLPGGDVRLATDGSGVVHLTSGASRFQLRALDPSDFPTLPQVEGGPWQVDARLLREGLERTEFAASPEESRPVLSGVLVEVEGGHFRAVATDSSRLAFYQVPLVPPEEGAEVSAEPLHVLVPGRSLGEVRRLLAGLEEPVVLRVSEHHVSFQTSTFLFFSRLIEGVFPDYRRVFPKEQQVRLTVDRLALLEALERIALVSRKGPAVVRLQVDGELQLESHGAEAGQASESVPVEELEGAGRTAYQVRYLTEVLRVLSTPQVRFAFSEGDHPGTIEPVGEEGYTYVVMPVRLP
ncbi:MAG: DNA polymerase III subunit beta [Firmicutes bacterium]|nr:DNA polymerase III subunit beta [Bacillota bacterium]MBO2519001.1 DNA polymerase III subunit beta [Bacillota bacterium]